MPFSTDPVHVVLEAEEEEGYGGEKVITLPGWYFWDETWANRHGPFPTREEAQEACNRYAASL